MITQAVIMGHSLFMFCHECHCWWKSTGSPPCGHSWPTLEIHDFGMSCSGWWSRSDDLKIWTTSDVIKLGPFLTPLFWPFSGCGGSVRTCAHVRDHEIHVIWVRPNKAIIPDIIDFNITRCVTFHSLWINLPKSSKGGQFHDPQIDRSVGTYSRWWPILDPIQITYFGVLISPVGYVHVCTHLQFHARNEASVAGNIAITFVTEFTFHQTWSQPIRTCQNMSKSGDFWSSRIGRNGRNPWSQDLTISRSGSIWILGSEVLTMVDTPFWP